MGRSALENPIGIETIHIQQLPKIQIRRRSALENPIGIETFRSQRIHQK